MNRKGTQMSLEALITIALLLGVLAVGFVVIKSIKDNAEGTKFITGLDACSIAATKVGAKGQCFTYASCSDENDIFPAKSAAGTYWQNLGKLGCPEEGYKTEQKYCCSLIVPGGVTGTGAVLKCARDDPGYTKCHNAISNDDGKWIVQRDGDCFECSVNGGKCAAEQSTAC